MLRRALIIVFAVVLASGWAGAAWAVDGGKADPTGDVFDPGTQQSGPGPLDIVKVSHHDDGERVTYTVRTAHPWATTEMKTLWLNIEELPGLPRYDCQQVAAIVFQAHGQLDGHISQCFGSGSGEEGGPGGTKDLGPVVATHGADTDTITVSFDLASLRTAGFTGTSYRYNVAIEPEEGSRIQDVVPNDGWISHTFDVPATPVPTVAPTAVPTAEPTPRAVVEPTPEPTLELATPQAGAQSFAAPQERTSDDDTSPPLRAAAAGSVIAGAGIALVRFWPF